MTDAANVLRLSGGDKQNYTGHSGLFGRVSAHDYRRAIARTINELKAEKHLTNESLAEALGCSEGTIANAENERGNLDAVTALNLAAVFGGQRRLIHLLALINGSPDTPPTVADRLALIDRELAAIRKEVG